MSCNFTTCAHIVGVQRVEEADELHAVSHLLLVTYTRRQRRYPSGSAALLSALQDRQVARNSETLGG